MGVNRRQFLGAGAGITAGSLSGCVDEILEGDTEPSESTPTESEPEYDLQILSYNNGDTVDLSGLDVELDQYTEEDILEDFSFELEYSLLKNGETATPEELSIQLNGSEPEKYEHSENKLSLPCTEAQTGTNTLLLEAQIDGETLYQKTEIEKILPNNYRLEPLIEGEPLTPEYTTPFNFDTHNLNKKEFYKKREQATRNIADDNINPQKVLENIDKERIQNDALSNEYSEKEQKRRALFYISADVAKQVGWSSIHAARQAANEEIAMKQFTPFNEVYTGGFNNPMDQEYGNGGHGSKVAYVKDRNGEEGDWYHLETIGTETLHVNNLEEMDMMGDPEDDYNTNGEYLSILGEFREEGPKDGLHSLAKKLDSMASLLGGQTMPGGDVNIKDMYFSDPFAIHALEMIRENKPREDIMEPLEAAADHNLDTDMTMNVFGSPSSPVIYATEENKLRLEMRNNPDFTHSPESAKEWLEN